MLGFRYDNFFVTFLNCILNTYRINMNFRKLDRIIHKNKPEMCAGLKRDSYIIQQNILQSNTEQS